MAKLENTCCGRVGFLVLPAVYDEALSYQEELYHLCEKVNEIISYLAEQDDSIYDYVDRAVASALAQAKSYTDAQVNTLYQQVLTLLSALYDYVDNGDAALKNSMTRQFNEVWEYLHSLPTGGELVIDPTTGLLDTVQNALDHMWQALSWQLTCQEYKDIGLTCQEYADEGVTCFQYAWYGKMIWIERLLRPLFYMTHPYTGLTVFYQEVINWLASFHMEECPTCDEYEGLDHTCAEYNALNITCYEYVSQGRTILGIAIPPTGDISLATVEEVKNIIGV